MDNGLAIIFCPPLSKHPLQPSDMSVCTLEECPDCKNKMWLSFKKKQILESTKLLKVESICICYDCVIPRAERDEQFRKNIAESCRVDI